jgi:hypothetical protein
MAASLARICRSGLLKPSSGSLFNQVSRSGRRRGLGPRGGSRAVLWGPGADETAYGTRGFEGPSEPPPGRPGGDFSAALGSPYSSSSGLAGAAGSPDPGTIARPRLRPRNTASLGLRQRYVISRGQSRTIFSDVTRMNVNRNGNC